VGERFLDTEEATGSIPVSPTTPLIGVPSSGVLLCTQASRHERSRRGAEELKVALAHFHIFVVYIVLIALAMLRGRKPSFTVL
jgi:hypothetical protein